MTINTEHTRPFNMADAKEGAHYCLRNGNKAEVLKWDCNRVYALAGVANEEDEACSWTSSGKYLSQPLQDSQDDLVMTPLGFIEGKPVFTGDVITVPLGSDFVDLVALPANRNFTGCKWPSTTKERIKELEDLVARHSAAELASLVRSDCPSEAQVMAAARVLSDRSAEVCCVNHLDNWNFYSEDYIADARSALKAAWEEK